MSRKTPTAKQDKPGSKAYSSNWQRWQALVRRDPRAEGRFVYSVHSTGIYCRPTCPSRLAARTNVAFHGTAAEAKAMGFRPCKRCRPDEDFQNSRQITAIKKACELISNTDSKPDLSALAEKAGFSRFHFQRLFKRLVGVTPGQFAAACQTRRVQGTLRSAGSVTDAIYEAGFSSGSRFYEKTNARLGMTPARYRAGGSNVAIRHAVANTPLGLVLVAATDQGICSIRFGDSRSGLEDELKKEFPNANFAGADKVLLGWVKSVVRQIRQPATNLNLPLDARGTAFQHQVWEALRTIPPGQTRSYTDVAHQLGKPAAVRAVARACATNPVAVVIPCHRVLGRDGSLRGYRWGMERKRKLLDREMARKAT